MRSIYDILDLYSRYGQIDKAQYHLNLLGIRHADKVDMFDDELYYFWTDGTKIQYTALTEGFTTDPGKYYLKNPMNTKGCAIVKEGWYPRVWVKGKHNNKYNALIQRGNTFTVYRDKNKDDKFDFSGPLDTGYFGINLHRASQYYTVATVNNYSAGCQVIADPNKFNTLMTCVDKAGVYGQSFFSYLLLDSKKI